MKLISIIITALILISCSGNDRQSTEKKPAFLEPDKGDSIFYYRNFDWYHFRGIDHLDMQEELPIPFVKLIYQGDKLIMKVRYLNNRDRVIHFFRLQGKWAKRNFNFIDGDSLFNYKINVDTAMLELEFRGDPLDPQNGPYASLRQIKLEYPDGDTIRQLICNNFYKEKLLGMPDIRHIDMKSYADKCDKIFYVKDYVKGDSICSAYIVYSVKGTGNKIPENDWVRTKRKLYFNSFFLTNFAREQDWESQKSLRERVVNMIESNRKNEQ